MHHGTSTRRRAARRRGIPAASLALAIVAAAGSASAMQAPALDAETAVALKRDWATSLAKIKGPYSENFCVCRKTGEKKPVMDKSGRITSPCGNDALFCAAFRSPAGEGLARHRVWVANVFSRDLWLWPQIGDHHDLVRGTILEKYFVETNPSHKLAQLRAYGGLSGSEYETGASTAMFERYLAEPGFDDSRHFPLAYELQRRFFVRDDLGQVEKVRSMAVRIQAQQSSFKPLRDAIHNQLSAGLIPKVEAYRAGMPAGALRGQVDELIVELRRLTSLDEGALRSQLAELQDAKLKAGMSALVPAPDADPVAAVASLGRFMRTARNEVAARRVGIADVRRLVDLDITAGAVLQRRGSALLEGGKPLSAKQGIELLGALVDASYGAGLLLEREREAAAGFVADLLADGDPTREALARGLARVGRVVEWAQANAVLPYAEVWAAWTYLMPQVAGIGDDVLRSSPLLLFAQVYGRLVDFGEGSGVKRHDFFGTELTSEVRALNPGLAAGRLRVAPPAGGYGRNEVIALPETPADLQPAAGILTRGEGNVLSHVQLLARSLGIPNVVLGPAAYEKVRPHDGKDVLLVATPGGRVVIEELSRLSNEEKAVWAEFTRNDSRRGEGSFGADSRRLHIDTGRIDLSLKTPVSLDRVRRADSGRTCGPKAAFLGELKALFPDKVARGIVVPFGAYRDFYDHAAVTVPAALRGDGLARDGEPLAAYVERVFGEFFGSRIASGADPKALSAWIAPRLEVIRHSILEAPLPASLRTGIRDELDRAGLLVGSDKTRTVGCFVRSDTNVEDLDSFNGAGLNLTIFNMGSIDDILGAMKKVWASPFELRSFSWRQSVIDQPLWVLPSVVILESIPSDKSGVLVTCDIEDGSKGRMTIATSEGVGGAVDGTSAETLLWSPGDVELLTLYKSAWKNALIPGGGNRVVPASGSDRVLSEREVEELVKAGKAVEAALEPARDPGGRARPWDIEFGFAQGKLWLFQSRPFIGNESVKNVPALAVLDGTAATGAKDRLSLDEVMR